MNDLDRRRIANAEKRGGLPSVEELVAIFRIRVVVQFPIPDVPAVVKEGRRRIREAAKRLERPVRTHHSKRAGVLTGELPMESEQERARWLQIQREAVNRL